MKAATKTKTPPKPDKIKEPTIREMIAIVCGSVSGLSDKLSQVKEMMLNIDNRCEKIIHHHPSDMSDDDMSEIQSVGYWAREQIAGIIKARGRIAEIVEHSRKWRK